MADVAEEHVWKEDADGVMRLVAAPGDPLPEDDDVAVGYQETVDPRADTADAKAVAKASVEDKAEKGPSSKKGG